MRPSLFQVAVGANALFSGSTGVALAASPAGIAQWLGHPHPLLLRLIGLGLIGFAALLVFLAAGRRRSVALPLLVCAADLGWVLGTAALALLWPAAFTAIGWAVAAAVAVIVLAFAVAQYVGLVRFFRSPRGGPDLRRICLDLRVNVPREDLWLVVRRVGDISSHASNLVRSAIIPEASTGEAIVRECADRRGRSWREALSIDDDRMRIEATFDTAREGFPFPFRDATGGWELLESDGGSRVRIWWDVRAERPGLFAWTAPLLAAALAMQMSRVVHSMAADARSDFRGPRLPLAPVRAFLLC